MVKIWFYRALACVSLLMAFGCSTVNSRIKENELQFLGYPPEIQAQIQSGRIDRGFTEDMVYMARGKPAEKNEFRRKTPDGKEHLITLWKYTRPYSPAASAGSSSSLSRPYGFPQFGPGPNQPIPVQYDRGYFTVQFEKGRVMSWDQGFQED